MNLHKQNLVSSFSFTVLLQQRLFMRNILILSIIVVFSCNTKQDSENVFAELTGLEGIKGKSEYLNSPFLTSGERLYIVGHQNGTFPDLGWHVKGEMGGVWMHPIKLMDGYSLSIKSGEIEWCEQNAEEFWNYPISNKHTYSAEEVDLMIERYQFVPDSLPGAVISYQLSNTSPVTKEIELNFTGMIDLRPVWLSDSLEIRDGRDAVWWNNELKVVNASDSLNDWFVSFGSDGFDLSTFSMCKQKRNGNGIDQSIRRSIKIGANQTKFFDFFIAGSLKSAKEAHKVYYNLKENKQQLVLDKHNRYQILAETNKIVTGDYGFDLMFRWIKYNTAWLILDVPGLGRGLTAGNPDYPWFFGTDMGYAIEGLLNAGMHKEALSTIKLIFSLSKKSNGNSGRIMHEASTNGVVFNPGNLNTTPKFIHAVWKAYLWTGDQTNIDKYYQDILNGVKWIESMDKDSNFYPDGPGMMEIPGLHTEMVDVVAYLCQMYEAAAGFAGVVGDEKLTSEFKEKALKIKEKLNSEWWVEEFNSYADFRAEKHEAIELTEQAITRADTINKPWSVEELTQTLGRIRTLPDDGTKGYVVHHNWVVNTPMEVGAADADKALIALNTSENYTNRFGMFVTGIDRDEEQEQAEKWKAFSYVGAVMTLPTGVQAISEARYERIDKSFEYLKMLQNSFSYALPGSMYEVSPDFGMMVQAWNIYAIAVPVVSYYFGIQPNTAKKKIIIQPNLPSTWKEVSLENIKVGENVISVKVEEGNLVISQKLDWELVFINDKGDEFAFKEAQKVFEL